jgi:hypothetical protein
LSNPFTDRSNSARRRVGVETGVPEEQGRRSAMAYRVLADALSENAVALQISHDRLLIEHRRKLCREMKAGGDAAGADVRELVGERSYERVASMLVGASDSA